MKPSNRSRLLLFFGMLISAFTILILTIPVHASVGPGSKTYLPNMHGNGGSELPATITPQPTLSPTPTATIEPPKQGVTVLPNWSHYVDSIGYLHIIGEVENNTSGYIDLTKVSANFFNSNGSILDTDNTYTVLDVVEPGEKACFEMLLREPDGWASTVFESPTYYAADESRPALTVTDHRSSLDDFWGWYEIVGQIRNDDTVAIDYAKAVATGYDHNGKVVACDSGYVNADTLYPGSISAFDILMTGELADKIVLYALQTEGLR